MGAKRLVFEIDGASETPRANVVPHGRVQLREAVGQLCAFDDLVGDAGQQLLGRRQLPSPDLGLVHLCLRGRKLQLQPDAEPFVEFGLVVDRLQCVHPQVGQLAEVVYQARLRDGDGDVVEQPLFYGRDDDRRRWVGTPGERRSLAHHNAHLRPLWRPFE